MPGLLESKEQVSSLTDTAELDKVTRILAQTELL